MIPYLSSALSRRDLRLLLLMLLLFTLHMTGFASVDSTLIVRDDFNRGALVDLTGSPAPLKWVALTSQDDPSATLQLNTDSTISPRNSLGIGHFGGVAWDSLLTDTTQIGVTVTQKGGNGFNTSFFIFVRMDSKDLMAATGYCLRYFDIPTGADRLEIQRIDPGVTQTTIAALDREIMVGDTLIMKVEKDKTMKALVYGADGIRDSISVADNTYNPSSWYCWLDGCVFSTPVKMDNFIIGKIPQPAPKFSSLPSSLHYDTVMVGAGKVDSVIVTNSGTDTLRISSVLSSNARFTVTPGSVILPPASGRTYYVTFTPLTKGLDSGTVTFNHNAVGSPGVVHVYGIGLLPVFSIIASGNTNGSIVPSGVVQIDSGSDRRFTFVPVTGYHVDSVIVDGAKVDSTVGYTFANVKTNHAIRVTFAINQFTITASVGSNGSITPSGSLTVNYGNNRSFTLTASTGYHVDSVLIDGVKVDSTASYTFTNVQANHTIRVTFAINQFTITASAGSNGSITPSGSVSVNYGTNRLFTFTPATGYHADSVIVDGVKIDSTVSYTFTNIQTNHTIRVTFAVNQFTITASAGSNGSMTPSGLVSANYGTSRLFTFTPAPGYHADSVIVDEVKVDSTVSYTFTNIQTNHTIRVTFAINQYIITASAGLHGTISPSGAVTITYGSSQQFFMTPAAEYYVDSILIDGVNVPDSTSHYTFHNVSGNHTIHATFAHIVQKVTVHLLNGWNIISVPVELSDYRKTTVYPTSVTSAFAYEGAYTIKDTLTNGVGYWMRFNGSQDVSITGFSHLTDTNNVVTGWNMVGSVSDTVPISTIISQPGGIMTSSFFEYNGSYRAVSAIIPGKGYWVKVEQDGMLIFGGSAKAISSNHIQMTSMLEQPPPPPSVAEALSGEKHITPKEYRLEQNYPNPFNPVTTIRYALPANGSVRLTIYNMLGQEVVELVNEFQEAGMKTVSFDAGNLPSGMYAYRITAGTFTDVKKMLLVK